MIKIKWLRDFEKVVISISFEFKVFITPKLEECNLAIQLTNYFSSLITALTSLANVSLTLFAVSVTSECESF